VKAPESSIRFLGFTRSCDTNATATGKFINEYALPTNLNMQNKKKVPKQWRSGGLTFNNNYSTLFTNVEEPLYEDGQCLNNKGGMIRLFAFDAKAVKTPHTY
jgi:2-hydroxy-3-keto-5-methylthiopentenyl-1-phosphate phosphatase